MDPQKAERYATEEFPVDEVRFISIDFYRDGQMHRVSPHIGRTSEHLYQGRRLTSHGRKHFHVLGAFETHGHAREAAISAAWQYLAVKDWECRF
jgi:hypothetical protein